MAERKRIEKKKTNNCHQTTTRKTKYIEPHETTENV